MRLSRMLSVDETKLRDALAYWKTHGVVIERKGKYEVP